MKAYLKNIGITFIGLGLVLVLFDVLLENKNWILGLGIIALIVGYLIKE